MHKVRRFCIPLLSSTLLSLILSESVFAKESAVYLWQKKQLLSPDESTIQYEKEKQKVVIYEGLTIEDVENALNQQFNRVEHMMFVGTVLPPTAAGVPQQEADGCE